MIYPTLLFDFDHTLFDSDTSERVAFADTLLKCCGVTEAHFHFDSYQRINQDLWSAVEAGLLDPNEVRTLRFELLAGELGLDISPVAMADTFSRAMADNGDLYPGAREVIAHLAASSRLALVTNAISDIQRARIVRLDIAKYFDAIVISSEVGSSKPNPTIFDIAFRRLGDPPRETAIMIGDSLTSDIRGAANYGIATCWYNPKGRTAAPSDQITHEIHTLEQLLILAGHTR